MTTKAELITWLKSTTANRVILVEVQGVLKNDGTTTDVYLSNKPFTSRSTDTPANTGYIAAISGGITFSENLNLDGSPSLGLGDIELDNRNNFTGGDTWFNWVWTNKVVNILIGDATWAKTSFYTIFTGLVRDIDTSGRSQVNLLLVNRLEKLNIAISETLVGGTSSNKDQLIPLTFGECFNVTPVLIDPATLTYQVHNGPIEGIIEVRDNGAPLTGTSLPTYLLSEGKFRLAASPFGTITASVQGYKKTGTTYSSRVGSVISNLMLNYVTVTPSFSLSASTLNIIEGESVTVTLTTTEIPDGTLVPYTISGTGISAADLGLASLSGNFTVSNNQASVILTSVVDASVEGPEIFTLTLTNQPTVIINVTLGDTVAAVSQTSTSLVEGDSVTFTVTPNFTGTLWWSLDGTNITSTDFTDGIVTGSLSVVKNTQYTVTKTLAIDTTAGEVLESFIFNARVGSGTGGIIGSSQSVSVSNTTATVTASTTTLVEGDSVTFTITPNYNGTLFWSIDGTGVVAGDFVENSITGSLTVTKGTAYTVTRQLTLDTLDPGESMVFNTRVDSTSGLIIGSSPTITITDTSVTISTNVTSVNEGGTVVFTVTPNFTGSLSWTIKQVSGTITTNDFSDVLGLSGSISVTKGTAYTITKVLSNDTTTEGSESFALEARVGGTSGTIVNTSATVSISDTSLTPPTTVTLGAYPTSINEASTGTFNITTNAEGTGTVLYYVVVPTSPTTSADFVTLSGIIATTGGVNRSFTITPTEDFIRETTTETFVVEIRQDSVAGVLKATTNAVTITDTSFIDLTTVVNPIVESGTANTYTITVGSLYTNTTLYWAIENVTTAAADFSGATSGTLTSGASTRSFTITAAADLTTEGVQTFKINILTGSTAGTIVYTYPVNISITDTSTNPIPTATVTSTPTTSVDEGSTITFNIATTNFATGTLYYSISGAVAAADFQSGSLTGSFAVSASSGTVALTLVADAATEGAESFTFNVRTDNATTGSIIGSRTITVNDTSVVVSANISPSATSLNEGGTLTFTVTTTGISNGVTLWYRITGTGINTADFTDNLSSASFTVNSNSATINKTLANDLLTEGSETLQFIVSQTDGGTALATSTGISVADTSTFASSIKMFLDAGSTSSYDGTGTTWTDLSGNGNSGTLINSVAYSTANNGTFRFDAVDDHVTVPNNLTYNNTYGFSFSVWVMPFTSGEGSVSSTGDGANGRILDKTNGTTTTASGFWLRMNAAQDVSFQINNSGGVATTGSRVPYGLWTHIIVTVSSAGAVNVYINGNTTPVVSGTTQAPSFITTGNFLTIGNRSGTQDSTFDGNISAVKFYTKALTATEITGEYNALSSRYTIAPVTSGALLYVDAKDYSGSGTTWSDTSGNANNLTLFNAPVFSRANAGYFALNGSTQYAERTAFTPTLTSATFLAWVYDTGVQYTGAGILFNRHAGDTNAHGLNLYDSGLANSQNLGYHWNDTTPSWSYDSGIAIPDAAWCMVALTVTSNTTNFYIYTTTTTPATNSTSSITNNSATFAGIMVGRDSLSFSGYDQRYFNGRIGAAVLYNRALSQSELTQNYNAMRARFGV